MIIPFLGPAQVKLFKVQLVKLGRERERERRKEER